MRNRVMIATAETSMAQRYGKNHRFSPTNQTPNVYTVNHYSTRWMAPLVIHKPTSLRKANSKGPQKKWYLISE